MNPPAPIRRLLIQAIDARRRVVAALIDGTPGPEPAGAAERSSAGPAAADDEETLRRFMVVAWPAAGRDPLDPKARSAFFTLLARLETPAMRDDLRFLDAWNNAFELMTDWPAAARDRDETRAAIRIYARILDHQAGRLAGVP